MKIELRQEKPADYQETENLTREAFWNQYAPGCSEHYILHVMRNCPAFVPELDIVAEADGKIVGNVIYTKAVIAGDDGKKYEVLCLGPISVLPEYQRKGIGRKMIEDTQKQAKEMGFRAVLLCGDPKLYSRMGFVPAETFGIRTGENKYMAALQAFELYEGALSGAKGRYYEDSVFAAEEEAVREFDRHFPEKERLTGTPSQKRFEIVAGMMREAEK